MEATRKIRLRVVVFEKEDSVKSTVSRDDKRVPVPKKMIFDVEAIRNHGIRKYDNRPEHPPQDWCVMFDKLKDGETIIVAMPMAELEKKLVDHGIINVLS